MQIITIWFVVGVAAAILIGLLGAMWQHFSPPVGSKISSKVIVKTFSNTTDQNNAASRFTYKNRFEDGKTRIGEFDRS